jgi:F-type H+-transporting ATPase subunit b
MIDWIPILTATAETASAVKEDVGVVEGIAKHFHVNWPFFISQCVNFLIIALVLAKFAYRPVRNMLEQRRQRIAEGEEKLKEIEKQLAESEQRTAEALAKANDEAKRLIEEAKQSATTLSEQKAAEALEHARRTIEKAEVAAKAEREKMAVELRKEFGRLIAATTGQVTGKVLTAEDHRRINEEALASVES